MDDEAGPSRADQVRLYLDTLQARMDPDQFRILGRLLTGTVAGLASPTGDGRIDLDDDDQVHLTREVKQELLAVLGIVATGTMEQHIVDLGNGSMTVMDPDTAADPDAVQQMRDWATRERREREHTDAVLRGIAGASTWSSPAPYRAARCAWATPRQHVP
ncbi:hypothetical protein [Kitasatospora sp. NPDC059462]|uniref:hypothetical protein n=1 Tax=Kitasatospora sp. NPDC059462 TaxID=3346841 RepID=UPI0036C35FA6